MSATESRIEDMLDALTNAAVDAVLPLRGDGPAGLRERLRSNLAAALRGTVKDPGGQEIDGARLTIEDCRASALNLLAGNLPNNPGQREAIVSLVAALLRDVREADQRERWISEGFGYSAREAERRAARAEQRVGELEHAVRQVKRATREVRVGRA